MLFKFTLSKPTSNKSSLTSKHTIMPLEKSNVFHAMLYIQLFWPIKVGDQKYRLAPHTLFKVEACAPSKMYKVRRVGVDR
jgi:hypothetical protein